MRKHFILLVSALLCAASAAFAVPAKPGKITVTQPDGSTIVILKKGDEWNHWVTDEKGNLLVEDSNGFLRPATAEQKATQMAAGRASIDNRFKLNDMRKASAASSYDMTHGERRIPVVLLEFQDTKFTTNNVKNAFNNLLNQQNYGGKGSVRDYYLDNSMNAFSPQFDVYGPVTVNSDYAYYGTNSGGNDKQPELAFYEACQEADNDIDFSQYDYDGDGDVDMILFYYAGYGEADYYDSKTIWPHQHYFMFSGHSQVATNSFDGKRVNRYFCTSELQGTGSFAGIGTTCHEFAHSLGLPDFYDSNYNEYGDGTAGATYKYDIMCDGPYNDNQSRPPFMNAEERVMLGWMDAIPDIPASGSITIPSVDNNIAYKSPTATEGEYFIYECRSGKDWDSYVTGGLLVYHVDKSKTRLVSVYNYYEYTPYYYWNNWDTLNAINCNGSHPCFYIVPAGNQNSYYYTGSSFVFGTSNNYRSYTPVDWDGNNTLYSFSNITFSNYQVTMNVTRKAAAISGSVKDPRGNAVEGATVSIVPVSDSNSSASTTTAGDGTFNFDLSSFTGATFTVTASADGFYPAVKTVSAGESATNVELVLRDLVDGGVNGIHKFDDLAENIYVDGFGAGVDVMAAVSFYPEEMAPYEGRQIKSVSFAYYSATCDAVHLIVDFGTHRALTLKVPNPKSNQWNTIDVTQHNLIIPSGKDCYFGYAIKNPSEGPLLFDDAEGTQGGLFYADYNLTFSNWYELNGCNLLVSVELVPLEDEYIPFNTIDNPGNGVYNAGDTFLFRLNESTVRKPTAVSWFVDDDPVTDGGFVMAKGKHLIEARITENGKTKSVQLEIEAK